MEMRAIAGIAIFFIVSLFVLIMGVLICLLAVDGKGERTRRVRRRELQSARNSVNRIDAVIDMYYPQSDLVAQAMCDEIRNIIKQHREDITT